MKFMPPDFETMAYFTIDNIFPNLSDSQRESAATFIKLSLEAAFKAGREKGLDEASELVSGVECPKHLYDQCARCTIQEIKALKQKEPV
jgi:hypothetical protein